MKTKKIFRNSSGHFRAAWRILFYLLLVIGIYELVRLFTDSLLLQGEELSDFALLVNRLIDRVVLLICVLIPGIVLLKWVDRRPLRLLGTGLYKKAVAEFSLGMMISIMIIPPSVFILYLFGCMVRQQ